MKKHYGVEKDQLLKSCVNLQRFIKFIINDTDNDEERGELIGFVHAMRTIQTVEDQGKQTRVKIVKPYKK